MGIMLSQPETEKKSDQGEGLGLRYGLSSMQGWRPEMEDAHDVKLGLKCGLDDWSFFAVFDGHAGKCAAAYAAWHLLDYILQDSLFEHKTESCSSNDHKESPSEDNSQNEDSSKQIGSTAKNKSNGDEGWTDSNETPESDVKPPKSEKLEAKSESSTSVEAKIGTATKTEVQSDDQLPKNELSTSPPPVMPTRTSRDNASPGKKSEKNEIQAPKFFALPVIEQLQMVKNAIRSGFLKIDQSMRDAAEDMSGCTAVCALLSPTHLFIANCGDSRAVLADVSGAKFATEDHKPSNPKERKRIIDAGGTATQRINGTLAVSRALGDFEFKKDHLRGPCEQLVSPEPEITVIERGHSDEFLVLACDGIWDVMNNHEICAFVRYKLKVEPSLEKICSSVLDVCLRKGSRDNMSIIIVVFENGPKVQESAIEVDRKNDEKLLKYARMVLERDEFEGETDEDGRSNFPEFLTALRLTLDRVDVDPSNPIVPPGGGVEAKYEFLKEWFHKNFEEVGIKRDQ